MGNATTKDYSRSTSVGINSKKTRWDRPGLPAPPGRPILISGTNETQPDAVAIRWERSPSNGGSAIVGYLVEHRRLGSPHWVRSSSGLCAFPELTLSGLEPGWRYQFRVRAQNALGLSQPSEVSEPLTVTLQRPAVACAPHFDLELKDTVTLENEQTEFVAQFFGTPLPKISWFKDGFEIFSSRRTRIITDSGKSILLIHQTALNDEGEIKCTATNRAGHVATRAKLILEAPPRIRLPRQYEDGLLFEQDETIRLKVSLAGRPTPIVTWYHDGELISKDARHMFETTDGESVLKIPDAKRSDRGEYTVKVTNKLGEDTASFLVTVTDRPAAPGKIAVTMTLGRSVSLSWKEPEDDGGCKIGTYIVEYYRIGWEVWLKAITSRRTTVTLIELIEGSEYKFRVKAENPYGVSDPSEESDVIFVPGIKRRATPSLNEKSQSHREISRSRGDKREVSFTTPAQRTRSLTREEAKTRDESNGRFGYDERSASVQRLAMPTSTLDRPSRADSRVTFALDTLENEQPPIPPVRSREHNSTKQQVSLGNFTNVGDEQDIIAKEERIMTQKTASTVRVSSPVIQEDTMSHFITKERSLSPLCVPTIQKYPREESYATESQHLLPSSKKQTAIVNEFILFQSDSLQSQRILPEDDENVLHGSSEFILVLYPEDEARREGAIDMENSEIRLRNSINGKRNMTELTEDANDLIPPPPISLSLPELFSTQHQVVEIIREAVSSTELLHEQAMERFYRAVAAEEASEIVKQKMQFERQTKLTLLDVESIQRPPLRRRLSNSGVTTENLIASWQAKKNRRRSSEGQTDAASKTLKLLSPVLLADVEARSDPNFPSEMIMADPWERSNRVESIERLRRWHEANVPLMEEVQREKSIQMNNEEKIVTPSSIVVNKIDDSQEMTQMKVKETEEENNSIETSEESSEEISSADSEDLKLLKSRILARQIIDEEDTYHPRGRPVPHVEPEIPQIPYDRLPILEISSLPPRAVTPVSPNNVMPKSILKKPKEEMIQDNFGRSIPPEKPIRKTLSQSYQPEDLEKIKDVATNDSISNFSSMPEALKTPTMSESDTDSIVSAAEAAKSRRMQSKWRSITPEEEAAEAEARMAVINQYTEIVREYSSHSRHGSAASSRRSSISEDQDQKYRMQEKLVPKLTGKQEQDEKLKSKIKNNNPSSRRENNNSRSATPARDTMTVKRKSRPNSRDQSPAARRSERIGGASSRSSSKTRKSTPSEERNQFLGKNDLYEQGPRRSRVSSRPSSRSSSRSSSRERFGTTVPVESKVEKLQKALESSKYRAMRKEIEVTKGNDGESSDRINGKLALEAKRTVRSTVSYITDLTLLMAAMYVYFFKKEILAVPFIVLLLYRRVQEGIHGWIPRRWRRSTKDH